MTQPRAKPKIWQNDREHYFVDRVFRPLLQTGPHCVPTSLAAQAGQQIDALMLSVLIRHTPAGGRDSVHYWLDNACL